MNRMNFIFWLGTTTKTRLGKNHDVKGDRLNTYLVFSMTRYLVVDEIDKMTTQDEAFLANLKTGIVSETKKQNTRLPQGEHCLYISYSDNTHMNELSSEGRTLVRIHSDKVRIIDAVCTNCNKRFKSMRAVSMHLKMTSTRHTVNFINYGNYDKKTGLRELNRPEA